MNIKLLPALLRVDEVADILRVSKLTVKRWEKRGVLKPLRINQRGDRRYKSEEVLKIINQ